MRLDDLHYGANQGLRGVVLAAIAAGVPHVPDLGFVEIGALVLLAVRPEVQLIKVVNDLAQVIAALDLVLDLSQDLADFVLGRVGAGGVLSPTSG